MSKKEEARQLFDDAIANHGVDPSAFGKFLFDNFISEDVALLAVRSYLVDECDVDVYEVFNDDDEM